MSTSTAVAPSTPDAPELPAFLRSRSFPVLWVGFWLVLSSAWIITSARQLSGTFDETVYLTEGLQRWRTGSTAALMKLGTMPLPVDVQTRPLYLWEQWTGKTIDVQADFEKILPWARGFSLVFWWLLLVHVWLAARSLGGPLAAALAVAFVACEPTLLGNAGLATTDIALAACVFALVYHFRVNREAAGWWRRIAWPAFWFGLAVLAKASGLVFGCACLFVLEAERCGWWRKKANPAMSFRRSFRELFQIGLLGMVLVFVWCGSDWQPQRSFVKWAHSLPEGPFAGVMVWTAEHLRIFSNAGEGIIKQVTHNVRGHGSYLIGNSHPRALWYYFPVGLTIKFTVPLILAPLAVAMMRRIRPRQTPWYANWALLGAATLLVLSLVCRVQIGIRFMFPLIVLAAVGVAAELVRLCATVRSRRLLLAGAGLCLGWTILEAVTVWPHGLCYVNRLWGGTRDGYRVVSEANYDWGQGLRELARWQRDNGEGELHVWYFGTDPSVARQPYRFLPLHALASTDGEVLAHLTGRRVAVSTTLLYGSIQTPEVRRAVGVFRDRQPVARTTTFLIYDFTERSSPSPRLTPLAASHD